MPPALGYRIEKEQQSGRMGLGLLRFVPDRVKTTILSLRAPAKQSKNSANPTFSGLLPPRFARGRLCCAPRNDEFWHSLARNDSLMVFRCCLKEPPSKKETVIYYEGI